MRYLHSWIDQLRWQRLKPMERLAGMLINHLDGILNYRRFKRGYENGSVCYGRSQTPTGKGLGLDSSESAGAPERQRSKRPWKRLMRPVYQ